MAELLERGGAESLAPSAAQAFALQEAHRLEMELMQTHIERLRAALREHGIPLPEEDPLLGASDGEHLAACRAVVETAYDLLERLEELRRMVGSGHELLKRMR